MADFLWRFGYRLGNDNNFRLKALWVFVLALLLLNLTFFGFGPATDFFPIAEEVQRYNNLEFRGRFATDRELNPPWWFWEAAGSLWAQLRWWSWAVWGVLFVVSVIYIPVSRFDEFGRAWRAGVRWVRERRGSPATGGAPPATPATGRTAAGAGEIVHGLFGQFWVTLREILGATIANLITHRGRR